MKGTPAERRERGRRAAAKSVESKRLRRPVPRPEAPSRDYAPPETEFLRACDEYQSTYKVRFMSATDYLFVLTNVLGYRRT